MKIYCPNCTKVITPEIPEGAQEIQCTACGAALPVPPTHLSPGVVIGDFLLERALSSGGMGVVYLARQLSLDRPVALKVLHEKFAGNQEYVEGLFREARAAAKLTHPHIVQAYAVGEEDGIFYFAMEYIRGETFKQILKKQSPLDFDQAVKVIKEICSALQTAWNDQKLVHQDIKPDNIMLDSNGFAKLADLGLAQSANSDTFAAEDENEVMGTPQYISPEQLTGVPTDVRSDIYSLGATFYQFLTGSFPYPEESAEAMARKHVEGNLTPPIERNPAIPPELNDIVVKMMKRQIEERYQSPADVIKDLDAYIEHKKSASIAVPKISLNINKKAAPGAKPGLLPPGPGSAAKPGIKAPFPPKMPSMPKPAAPVSKPAVPKPATPATPAPKPATPAAPAPKPATPATPAPKPATPATPSAPAPKPAAPVATPAAPQAAPAPQKTEEPTLVPKAPKPAEKKEEKASADEQKASRPERPRRNAGMLISIFVVIPIFLLVLATALYFAAQKGKLKEPGNKYVATVNKLLRIKSAAPAAGTASETPSAKEPEKNAAAQSAAPPAPVKRVPVTRKEFIRAMDKLIAFYRNDQAKNAGKFLEECDKLIAKYAPAETQAEKDLYNSLRKIYAWLDEERRAKPARDKAIESFRSIIAARAAEKQSAAEKARLESERKAREEALKRKAAAAADAIVQAAAKENERQTRELRNELDKYYRDMAEAFLKAVRLNDRTQYREAVEKAKSMIMMPGQTQEQIKLMADFKEFYLRFLDKAFKEFEGFHRLLAKITPDTPLLITWRGKIVDVIKIVPGKEVIYRSGDKNRTFRLNMRSQRARNELFNAIKFRYHTRHHPFYYEFLEGKLSIAALGSMPNRDWQKFIHCFDPPVKIKETLQQHRKAAEAQKAAAAKRAAAQKAAAAKRAAAQKAAAAKRAAAQKAAAAKKAASARKAAPKKR